jgi:predicted nucleotidyltransferase
MNAQTGDAPDFLSIIKLLTGHGVDFIVVGGVAANLFGSARLTYDLDIVYSRMDDNLRNIVTAFQKTNPYLRGAPPGLPFKLDFRTLKNGLNFTLTTDLGPIDLLGEIPGARSYEELLNDSVEINEPDLRFRCVTLRRLIELKNAAGRPKDLESLAELRAILEQTEGQTE